MGGSVSYPLTLCHIAHHSICLNDYDGKIVRVNGRILLVDRLHYGRSVYGLPSQFEARVSRAEVRTTSKLSTVRIYGHLYHQDALLLPEEIIITALYDVTEWEESFLQSHHMKLLASENTCTNIKIQHK